ncbi:hypothetical protein I309_02442 [Cryptococcus deuterogattii LA55]|nr:hypothetical protein I309_02442 [Cryptococcus deuterogattii LA55]KIR93536.1 hypothetical protein I304_02208 [Cryptococcus deuterogattii CBS 10090]
MSPAQSVSSTLSESPAQSALWSTVTSAVSIPYKIYNGARVFFQECKAFLDIKEPLFVFHTERSLDWVNIRLAGELCTDNPCIEYYYLAGNAHLDRQKYHFIRFMLEDGATVRAHIPSLSYPLERNEYCKAWAVTKQAVIFFEGIQESLKAWENSAEPRYEDEMRRVGAMLKKWKAYLGQFAF